MARITVGVPSGVGDVYWCLTKLQALAAGRRVTMCVQASQYDRALDWVNMVDFIAGVEVRHFSAGDALETGYAENHNGMDYILWPNTILDRGGQLSDWLPHLKMDLNFPVVAPNMGPPRTVLYASSVDINEKWMEGHGPDFWMKLVATLTAEVGPVTLVGAAWDKRFREQLPDGGFEDLVGKTTLPELTGIIRDARIVVGVICGVTILANHLRTPCVAFWPDQRFPPAFPTSWVAKDAPYVAVPASRAAAVDLRATITALAR